MLNVIRAGDNDITTYGKICAGMSPPLSFNRHCSFLLFLSFFHHSPNRLYLLSFTTCRGICSSLVLRSFGLFFPFTCLFVKVFHLAFTGILYGRKTNKIFAITFWIAVIRKHFNALLPLTWLKTLRFPSFAILPSVGWHNEDVHSASFVRLLFYQCTTDILILLSFKRLNVLPAPFFLFSFLGDVMRKISLNFFSLAIWKMANATNGEAIKWKCG